MECFICSIIPERTGSADPALLPLAATFASFHFGPFSSIPDFYCSTDNYAGMLLKVFSSFTNVPTGNSQGFKRLFLKFFLWATVLNRVIMTDNWREERYFIFPWKKEKVKLFVFQESLFFFFFCFKLIFGNTPLPLGNCVLAWVKCINCDGVQVAWERRCGFKVSGFPGVKLCAQNANSGYSRFQGIIFCGEEVCAATGSVKYHLPW